MLKKIIIIFVLSNNFLNVLSKQCNITCNNEYYNTSIGIECDNIYFCSCWCNTYVGPVCSCMDNRPFNYSYPNNYMKNNFTYFNQNFTSNTIKNKVDYSYILFIINIILRFVFITW